MSTTAARDERAAPVAFQLYRFTVEEYERLVDAGILVGGRVQLIDGEIWEMPPMSPPHAACIMRLERALRGALGERAVLRSQMPVVIRYDGEPEPDLALVAPPIERYATRHPGAEDILLLVEVSLSSLDDDVRKKLPAYAAGGIPEVWIANLRDQRIDVYRTPDAEARGYQGQMSYLRGQAMSTLAFPDAAVAVDEILGP